MFKEDTKKFYRNLCTKFIEAREPASMTEVKPCWRSLGIKAQNNERAEWLRREERRRICNMDWAPIQIMEIAPFLLKAQLEISWK